MPFLEVKLRTIAVSLVSRGKMVFFTKQCSNLLALNIAKKEPLHDIFLNIVDQFKYVLNKFEEVKFTNVFMGSNTILSSNNKRYLEQMVILTIILNANISAFIVCFSIFFFSLVHKSIFMVLESTKHSV